MERRGGDKVLRYDVGVDHRRPCRPIQKVQASDAKPLKGGDLKGISYNLICKQLPPLLCLEWSGQSREKNKEASSIIWERRDGGLERDSVLKKWDVIIFGYMWSRIGRRY